MDMLSYIMGAKSGGGGGGGGSYDAEWTRQHENICFASFEAVDDTTWDVLVSCSDGAMLGSFTASYDSGIDEWSWIWGDWNNSEVTPVPNYANYTNALQNNIASVIAPLIRPFPSGTTLDFYPFPNVIIVSRLSSVDVEIWG